MPRTLRPLDREDRQGPLEFGDCQALEPMKAPLASRGPYRILRRSNISVYGFAPFDAWVDCEDLRVGDWCAGCVFFAIITKCTGCLVLCQP